MRIIPTNPNKVIPVCLQLCRWFVAGKKEGPSSSAPIETYFGKVEFPTHSPEEEEMGRTLKRKKHAPL